MQNEATDSIQLQSLCKKLRIPLKGIYSKDTLPKKLTKGNYIINQDDNEGDGTHWVGLAMLNNREGFYWDSFGYPPMKSILSRAKEPDIVYNDVVVQDLDSQHCGLYVVSFLKDISEGKDLFDIVGSFHHGGEDDVRKNRLILKKKLGL